MMVLHTACFHWVLMVCDGFKKKFSLRLGDRREGEGVVGENTVGENTVGESTVGELSLSSLKLKLFLLSDSAPVPKRREDNKLDEASVICVSGAASVCNHCILL